MQTSIFNRRVGSGPHELTGETVTTCHACNKRIRGDQKDPVISAKSLGWNNYHDACAQNAWAGKKVKLKKEKEKKTLYRVDCFMMVDGIEQSKYRFFVDTMAEAEEICRLQQAPCPARTGAEPNGSSDAEIRTAFEVNITPHRYVNCRLTMLTKAGKKAILDDLVHPLGRKREIESQDEA